MEPTVLLSLLLAVCAALVIWLFIERMKLRKRYSGIIAIDDEIRKVTASLESQGKLDADLRQGYSQAKAVHSSASTSSSSPSMRRPSR